MNIIKSNFTAGRFAKIGLCLALTFGAIGFSWGLSRASGVDGLTKSIVFLVMTWLLGLSGRSLAEQQARNQYVIIVTAAFIIGLVGVLYLKTHKQESIAAVDAIAHSLECPPRPHPEEKALRDFFVSF